MPASADAGFNLQRHRKVVLIVDLVESVSLMQADELGVIQRWQAFLAHVNQVILPANQGRLVKSLGDGLLMEFDAVPLAAAAANAMHAWMAEICEPLASTAKLLLRAGIHAADVYQDRGDIYGVGVNLAARIASLARAGETVATAEARDLLTDELDAQIEDLGPCHLKHLVEPVHAFRLGPAALQVAGPKPGRQEPVTLLQPTIAVIPLSCLLSPHEFLALGDLLADSLISQLSLTPHLHVISRLSSSGFSRRTASLDQVAASLGARYVISGSYTVTGEKVLISVEMADATSGHIAWSSRIQGDWRDLLEPASELVHALADGIHGKILDSVIAKARSFPIPTLNGYELFLGGITLMHRASPNDFDLSRRLLESLSERHSRIASAHSWLAKWHVLRNLQGAAQEPELEASRALEHTRRALDMEPDSALALAVEGFVHCHLKHDTDLAGDRLRMACDANPNEPMAWLFSGVTHAFRGEAEEAVAAGRKALALSPMDPLRYFYESLMGSCEFSAGNFEEAARWCEMSRRRNRQHLSTLRALIAAYTALDRGTEATRVAHELLALKPGYTVSAYEAQSVAARYPFGREIARAMRSAGIPAR